MKLQEGKVIKEEETRLRGDEADHSAKVKGHLAAVEDVQGVVFYSCIKLSL